MTHAVEVVAATRIVVEEGEDIRVEEVVTEEEGVEAGMLTVAVEEVDTPVAVEVVAATKEAEEVMIETWTCVCTSIHLLLIYLSHLRDISYFYNGS